VIRSLFEAAKRQDKLPHRFLFDLFTKSTAGAQAALYRNPLTTSNQRAIFAYLNRRLHFSLHAIIDTAGKSLHGWFDAPPNKIWENRLKAGLEVFGCDPKAFTYSQPVRVPGAFREGKLQRLVWLRQ